MKHVFIINPVAGNKKSIKLIPTIEDYFKNKNDEYEIRVTTKKGETTKIAEEYHQPKTTIYSIGGDGTAFDILNGLNKDVSLAIIPAGTGNDYYRMIFNKKSSLKDILIKTIEGKEVLVDYGVVNNHRFLNSSIAGLDADINLVANEIKDKHPRIKKNSYILAVFKIIRNPSVLDFKIKVDDEEEYSSLGFMSGCMNGKYYGGGIKPAPLADIQDQKLDFYMINPVSILNCFRLLPRYLTGKHIGLPQVTYRNCEKVVIDSDKEFVYGCDGETFKTKHLEYTIKKKGLKLRVPQESELL